jgi:anti-sigma28 factor (negative regulator of flagellin synthesis)
MTVLAVRNETQTASRRRRFTSRSKTARMQEIKERLERGEYEVDPRAIADAIVRRLLQNS